MDPLLPLPPASVRPPLLHSDAVPPSGGPLNFPGVRASIPPTQQQGGLTIGKILFDSKDKAREDGAVRKRGFSDRAPSLGREERSPPVSEATSQDRPKKRVRERDQDLESDSDDSGAEREKERERVEKEEKQKLDEQRRVADEQRQREEEERRLERERLEKEAQEKMVPTQTVVVKGISIRATEEDVARCLADWGPLPLSAVRIIKDRITKISRGFAFVDFGSVKAAKKLMEDTKTQKLLLDGRKLHFEYTRPSEKPEEEVQDWVCSSCSTVNFARRTTCFKCIAVRTPDAKVAEPGAAQEAFLKQLEEEKTDNLIVRGLEPDVDEAALHYTFAKFGPIRELKVIRDRITLVSRGFAFVHYNTAEEAKAALLGTNNTRLDKTSGTILRVAFARPQPQRQPPPFPVSITAGVNTLGWQPKEFVVKKPAAQVVSTWEPKEFGMSEEERKAKEEQAKAVISEVARVQTQNGTQNQPETENQSETQNHNHKQPESQTQVQNASQAQTPIQTQTQTQSQTQNPVVPERRGMENLAAQVQGALSNAAADSDQGQMVKDKAATGPGAGYVWDEASGYYYDASTGYYYDGHKGLYYNGHTKVWYSFDTATQQYKEVQPEAATGVTPQAATQAASTGWAAQQQQAPLQQPPSTVPQPATSSIQPYPQQTQGPPSYPQQQPGYTPPNQNQQGAAYGTVQPAYAPQQNQSPANYGQIPQSYAPTNNSQPAAYGGGQFVSGNQYPPMAQQGMQPNNNQGYSNQATNQGFSNQANNQGFSHQANNQGYPNQAGAHVQPGWRPQNLPPPQNLQPPPNQQRPQNPQQQFGGPETTGRGVFVLGGPGGMGTEVAGGFKNGLVDGFSGNVGGGNGYRDRAAERRGLYGGPPSNGGLEREGYGGGGENRGYSGGFENRGSGGDYGRPAPPHGDEPPIQFERVDQNRALGNQNVGNRMLRNMGWEEGQGLGGGMVDPIKAERMTERAGLGVEVPKVDPRFEILPGDSYKVQMQKKAQQRFFMEQQRGRM